MARVAFEHAGKVYEDGTRALADFNLEIADGEFMVLVGPSGCGKTTALRMVAGLEAISEGAIGIGDKVVNALEPRKRDLAMVFQNYALYPHMSVYRNIGFGLKLRKTPPSEIRRRVEEIARVLGIVELLDKKPRQLSGGQRQRVAMGRAIIRDPQAFLMDEPLSNLDAKLRVQMRAEIARIQREVNATTIYVTHDQVEAMTMGDRVAVMNAGHLQQVDTPQVLYDQPVNEFVAGFIGSPSINLVESQLVRSNGNLQVNLGEHKLTVDDRLARNRSSLGDYVGKEIILGIRPEDFEDASIEEAPPERRITVTADLTEPLGSEVLVHFGTEATAVVPSAAAADVGEDADIRLGEGDDVTTRLVARVSPKSRIAVGKQVELAVDTSRLYFFDPETRAAI